MGKRLSFHSKLISGLVLSFCWIKVMLCAKIISRRLWGKSMHTQLNLFQKYNWSLCFLLLSTLLPVCPLLIQLYITMSLHILQCYNPDTIWLSFQSVYCKWGEDNQNVFLNTLWSDMWWIPKQNHVSVFYSC